jgi:oligopeptide transport system permease protein
MVWTNRGISNMAGHVVILRHLDFGTSLKYQGQSVNTIIRRSLPVSAPVGILAYLLALLVGIPAGSFAALKQNSEVGLQLNGDHNAGIYRFQTSCSDQFSF